MVPRVRHIGTFSWQDYDCQGWPSALVMGEMNEVYKVYTVLCVCVWGVCVCVCGGAEIEESRIKIPVCVYIHVQCHVLHLTWHRMVSVLAVNILKPLFYQLIVYI